MHTAADTGTLQACQLHREVAIEKVLSSIPELPTKILAPVLDAPRVRAFKAVRLQNRAAHSTRSEKCVLKELLLFFRASKATKDIVSVEGTWW